MKRVAAGLAVGLVLLQPAVARDPIRPAELPPPDYAGLQYVDSKGCMFVRAGTADEVIWIPRVTRDGTPVCGNPPSGRRAPVSEEGATASSAPETAPELQVGTESPAVTNEAAPGGYFVAVGSFGVAANSDRAEAKLRGLGYNVVRGRVQGGASTLTTVFAGPFPNAGAAVEARQDLRANGFPDAVVMGQ